MKRPSRIWMRAIARRLSSLSTLPTRSPPQARLYREKRRGVASGIVLQGKPTAPRARPAQPRGIVVARHAADLAGQAAF